MKKFCYTHLLNSKNSLRLGTYYQYNFFSHRYIYIFFIISKSTTRISARKLRLLTKNTDMNTEFENKDKDNDDNSSLPFKSNFSAQQNIIQRLSRAIIKCNDDVPH